MDGLYERIVSLCTQKGIKPGRMCNDLGISRGNVTDLKAGRRKALPVKTLGKIADYFGVSVDYLLGKVDIQDSHSEDLSEIDFALSGELHDLTDAEKQDILDYVRFKKGQREQKK